MDKDKAKAVLRTELGKYRERSYESLIGLIAKMDAYEIQSPSGAMYQLEIQAVWDDKPNSNLRVKRDDKVVLHH